MKSVSNAFSNAFSRNGIRTRVKIIAELGNNRFNDNQWVTASSTKQLYRSIEASGLSDYIQFWYPSDVFNNKNRNTMKYAVADCGARAISKTSTTTEPFRALSTQDGKQDSEIERGWWSLWQSTPDSILGWNNLGYVDSAWGNAVESGNQSDSNNVGVTGTFTNVSFGNPDFTGAAYRFYFIIDKEADRFQDYYWFTNQFWFVYGDPQPVADFGLQSDSSGKYVLFNVYDAIISTTNGPGVRTRNANQEQIKYPFDWQEGTVYNFRVSRSSYDSFNTTYWTVDVNNVHIGNFQLRAANTGNAQSISFGYATTFTERYGGASSLTSCSRVGQFVGRSLYHALFGDGQTRGEKAAFANFGPTRCLNSRISGTDGGYVHEIAVSGKNIFYPTWNSITPTPGPYNMWGGYPIGWPDGAARWIWDRPSNLTPVPNGQVWFRKKVTVGASTPCTIFITADNAFQLYLNGTFILQGGDTYTSPGDIEQGTQNVEFGISPKSTEPYGWQTTYQAQITLNAGDNMIAVQGINFGSAFGDSPAGVLCSLRRNSDNANLARSDASWKCLGYLNGPKSLTPKAGGGGQLNGTYYYQISSIYAGPIISSPSPEVNIIVGANSSVSLSWKADPRAVWYRIYRGTSPGGENYYKDIFSGTSFNDTALNWATSGGTLGSPISGTFHQPERVLATFDPRKINEIDLYLTESYSNMKQLSLHYLDSVLNEWIVFKNSIDITDKNQYQYTFPMDETVTCAGLAIDINKTWNAGSYARVSELQALYKKDISDDVISARLNQQREEYVNTVPVGMTRADTMDLELQNVDQEYSPNITSGANYPYITANNVFYAELGVDTSLESDGKGFTSRVLSKGPIGYWNWENTGTTATDLSGHDLDGIYGTGVHLNEYDIPFEDDINNSSILFDDTNKTYIKIKNIQPYLLEKTFSFEWWCKFSDINTQPTFWQWSDPLSSFTSFKIGASLGSPDGLIYVWTGTQWILSETSIYDGEWHHIVVTFSITDEILKIYIDGALDVIANDITFGLFTDVYADVYYDSYDRFVDFYTDLYSDSYTVGGVFMLPPEWYIGGIDGGSNGAQMGTSVLYDRQLTGGEVLDNYNAGINTVFDYVKMGKFYSDEWHVDGESLNASVQCRDFSKFLQDQKLLNFGKIWVDSTSDRVVKDLLCRVGLAPDEIKITPRQTAVSLGDPGYPAGYNYPFGANRIVPGDPDTNVPGVAGTYTDIQWQIPSIGEFFNIDWNLTIEYEAKEGDFWAHQFGWAGGDGGYAGFQAHGALPEGGVGKMVLFSVWSAIDSRVDASGAVAQPFTEGASGYRVAMPFNWITGRAYRFRIWAIGLDGSGNEWFGFWVKDLSSGVETHVGDILVPAAWGQIGNWSICWTERFGPTPVEQCGLIGYTSTVWSNFHANANTYVPQFTNKHFGVPHGCTNSAISDIPSLDLFAFRQEIGTPAPGRASSQASGSRTYDLLYLKDDTIWSFLAQLGFADGAMYGFDENGNFFYDGLETIEKAPYVVGH